MLEAVNLSYFYQRDDARPALKDINLTVKPGQWVAIMGANGSGKSTLARLLGGLLQPTTGCIRVDELDSQSSADRKRFCTKTGMVFQNPDNQLVTTVVEDELAFGPENLGLPPAEIEIRIEQALQWTGLDQLRLRAPHQLSGGEKQRVAIASILAMYPQYLILDEPTSMLDPAGRNAIMRLLGELCQTKGLAIVQITHRWQEAVQADYLTILGQGEIVQQGSLREVIRRLAGGNSFPLELPEISMLSQRLINHQVINGPVAITEAELVEQLCCYN